MGKYFIMNRINISDGLKSKRLYSSVISEFGCTNIDKNHRYVTVFFVWFVVH